MKETQRFKARALSQALGTVLHRIPFLGQVFGGLLSLGLGERPRQKMCRATG